jgi:hypothetical protein
MKILAREAALAQFLAREAAREVFWAVGTDESRRINWAIWQSAEPGSRIAIATLSLHVLEATVAERPRATKAETEVMVLEHAGRRLELTMFKSASAGYYDRHTEEWFPGADRDVSIDGVSARLVELRPRVHEQLDLFGG